MDANKETINNVFVSFQEGLEACQAEKPADYTAESFSARNVAYRLGVIALAGVNKSTLENFKVAVPEEGVDFGDGIVLWRKKEITEEKPAIQFAEWKKRYE